MRTEKRGKEAKKKNEKSKRTELSDLIIAHDCEKRDQM